MSYETVQTLLLLLLALIVGAFLGCICRRWIAPKSVDDASGGDATSANVATGKAAAMSSADTSRQVDVTPSGAPVRARGLKAPIGGVADDLKIIKGVGPKLESTLNGLGIYHFEQMTGWTKKDVEEVDDLLSFKGRIARDGWIAQAKALVSKG